VTQIFGSALPIAYNRTDDQSLWAPFAKLILNASYMATLYAACEAMKRHRGAFGSRKCFLTMLGGGVFGNKPEWILDAIRNACTAFLGSGLQVVLVSYAPPSVALRRMCSEFGPPARDIAGSAKDASPVGTGLEPSALNASTAASSEAVKVKRITQETFDEAVRDNMESFNIDATAAVMAAKEDFVTQGVSLDGLRTFLSTGHKTTNRE